jgi:hypothetical protein
MAHHKQHKRRQASQLVAAAAAGPAPTQHLRALGASCGRARWGACCPTAAHTALPDPCNSSCPERTDSLPAGGAPGVARGQAAACAAAVAVAAHRHAAWLRRRWVAAVQAAAHVRAPPLTPRRRRARLRGRTAGPAAAPATCMHETVVQGALHPMAPAAAAAAAVAVAVAVAST